MKNLCVQNSPKHLKAWKSWRYTNYNYFVFHKWRISNLLKYFDTSLIWLLLKRVQLYEIGEFHLFQFDILINNNKTINIHFLFVRVNNYLKKIHYIHRIHKNMFSISSVSTPQIQYAFILFIYIYIYIIRLNKVEGFYTYGFQICLVEWSTEEIKFPLTFNLTIDHKQEKRFFFTSTIKFYYDQLKKSKCVIQYQNIVRNKHMI